MYFNNFVKMIRILTNTYSSCKRRALFTSIVNDGAVISLFRNTLYSPKEILLSVLGMVYCFQSFQII